MFVPPKWKLSKASVRMLTAAVFFSPLNDLIKPAPWSNFGVISRALLPRVTRRRRGFDKVMRKESAGVLSTQPSLSWYLQFPSVGRSPLTLDYSRKCFWRSLVKCQQTDFLVTYTNNRLNADEAAAKLSEYRLPWNVSPCFCLFFPPSSESVTEVRTNIYVTSFGPVSDTDMVSVSLLPLLRLITAVSHQIGAGHQSPLHLLVWLW